MDDQVGRGGITELTNGHYMVVSIQWDSSVATDVGAVTWGNGLGGTVGVVGPNNSLVGTNTNDQVGYKRVTPLSNGHYVVNSPRWDNKKGAVTWGNGLGGTVGEVSAANSLVGSTTNDEIGFSGALALNNGNYVVSSPYWNNGVVEDVGAATWGNGLGGITGVVDASNSLIGSVYRDWVGNSIALSNGNYVVYSTKWDNGAIIDAGAITVANGLGGTVGPVNPSNSLVGSTDNDQLGMPPYTGPNESVIEMPDGTFVLEAWLWDNGMIVDAGAVIWSDGTPPNILPVLAEIGSRAGYVGKPLSFVASATDADLPAQTLTFSLEAGAPDGATIDPVSGLFSWPIDASVIPDHYFVTITVTDNGDPNLSDSESFTVIVVQDNFLNNYGFENPGATNKTAAGWNAVKTVKTDQRVCNTSQKPVAYEGLCAYRFQLTGAAEPARAIQRKTNSTDFEKDDMLELRGMVKANNLKTGARLVIKAVYGNGKQTVGTVALLPGTYDYQPFSAKLTLLRVPAKIVVQVKGGKAKGTFFVDDIRVAFPLPPGGSEIPPQPPDASELRGSN